MEASSNSISARQIIAIEKVGLQKSQAGTSEEQREKEELGRRESKQGSRGLEGGLA
jgi:hypothetical protein